MKRELVRYICIAILIIIFSAFVYPTPYYYTEYDNKLPLKINRITGHTEIYFIQKGWIDPVEK